MKFVDWMGRMSGSVAGKVVVALSEKRGTRSKEVWLERYNLKPVSARNESEADEKEGRNVTG